MDDTKNKIVQTFISSFTAMPSWLRNTLIVALVLGFFYFGYARKEIIYSKEKEHTELIYTKINDMNKKIEKIEDIRSANEDMLFNIEENRSFVFLLYELHREDLFVITKYMKNHMPIDDYVRMQKELDEKEQEYRIHVNEIFDKKSKKHLKSLTDD